MEGLDGRLASSWVAVVQILQPDFQDSLAAFGVGAALFLHVPVRSSFPPRLPGVALGGLSKLWFLFGSPV